MMKYYIKSVLKVLSKDDRIAEIDGIVRENNRKVYIQGGEYDEYSMDFIFLVNTGDFFDNTITFTVKINSFSLEFEVIKHFTMETCNFNIKQSSNISDYIISEIFKFKNESYLMVSNN